MTAAVPRTTAVGLLKASPDRVVRPDPRLLGYLLGGFGSLLVAIATGRHEFAAMGVPLLALVALGPGDQRDPKVTGTLRLDATRIIEADEVEGTVELDWDGEAELDVLLVGLPGVTVIDPAGAAPGWSLPASAGPVTLAFRLQARTWGRHQIGEVWVRARRPGGLILWETKAVPAGPVFRVLPGPLRLDRLLRPAEPRIVAGMHLSRLRGSGTDFAELRPYQVGDNLRDLSWSTSARLGKPWVIMHHPERTGTVVLMLESFLSADATSTEGLARVARIAWAVAALHLQAQDRVGLQAVGSTTAWLPPRGGRRARWLLMDELLSVGSAVEDRRQRRYGRPGSIPADALVVGVGTMQSNAFVDELLRRQRQGHTTVGLVVDIRDLIPAPSSRPDAAAQRLWMAMGDARRHRLERAGIPTADVTAVDGAKTAVKLLRQATDRRRAGAGTR